MNNNIYICVKGFDEHVLFTDVFKTICAEEEIMVDENNNFLWRPKILDDIQITFVECDRESVVNIFIDFSRNNNSYSIHKHDDLVCANSENIQINEILHASKIILEPTDKLLKNEEMLDCMADTYLGKLWIKKTKNKCDKYSNCVQQLRKKYTQIMETIGFLSLKELLLDHISKNYLEYLCHNNLHSIQEDNYDSLVDFCRTINKKFRFSVYDNENIKNRICTHIDNMCENVKDITHIKSIICEMYDGKYSELSDIYPEYYSVKMSAMKNKFTRLVEQTPICNMNDVFEIYKYIKEYEPVYDISNLISQNINVLYDINKSDAQKLCEFSNYENLHVLINQKIRNVCRDGNYSIECKLCYLFNLRNMIGRDMYSVGDEFEMYLTVEKYIQYLMSKTVYEEYKKTADQTQISCTLEKNLYCKEKNDDLRLSAVIKKLADLERKYVKIAKKYNEETDIDHGIDSMDDECDRDGSDERKNTSHVKYVIKHTTDTTKTNKIKKSVTK